MNKNLKNKVLARVMILALMGMAVAGCGKYDKISVLGEWTIDLKEAKGLNVEYATETLCFESGSKQDYSEVHLERAVGSGSGGNRTDWVIKGNFERKNNKITFSNRVKEATGEQMTTVTYKYRIEGDKLILIIEGEGFKNNEKIYIKKEGF